MPRPMNPRPPIPATRHSPPRRRAHDPAIAPNPRRLP